MSSPASNARRAVVAVGRGLGRPARRRSFPWSAPTTPLGVEPRRPRRRTGSDYETAWARRLPARYMRLAILEGPMRLMVRALASPERKGLDRLETLKGPAIFAANHHSHLDAPLMLTSIPEPWRHRIVSAAAADYFFSGRLRGAVSAVAMAAFPIDRSRVSRRSADQAADLLDEGWSLLIFPEGGRSPDGWGQGHRGGAAYLSLRCDVPVVPVHLEGTGRILARGDKRPAPGKTTVTFGSPMRPEPGENATRFADRIQAAVAALADEAATDWWQAKRRSASGESPPLTGPETTSWRRTWALGDRRIRGGKSPAWPPL